MNSVPTRVHLQASLSRSLYLAGDREDAVAAARCGVGDGPRDRRSRECLIAVLQALTIVTPEPTRLLEASTELRDVAIRIGDSWSAAYATGNMFRVARGARSSRRGRARCSCSTRLLADRGRFLMFQFMGHVYEAVLALAAGRFDEAEAAAERAHVLGDSSDTLFDAGVYGLQMFAIRREQGRLAEVLPLMRLLSARADADQQVWRPGLTALYAELGHARRIATRARCARATRLRRRAPRLGVAGVPHLPRRGVHRLWCAATTRARPAARARSATAVAT